MNTTDNKRTNVLNDPMGHAYNSVILDGQAYFCDLTWDASMIRANGSAKHFLKSYDEFYMSHHEVGFSSNDVTMISLDGKIKFNFDKEKYGVSITYEKQNELFGISLKEKIDEMISVGYLGGFVLEYLNFIKECKSNVEIEDLHKILKTVSFLEEYILSPDFKNRTVLGNSALAIPVYVDKDNKKNIAFYSDDENIEDVIKSVEGMVGRGR